MTDHDWLFDAVLASPDDDTPRLIYADYLEEQGGAVSSIRAKLVRSCCERDRLADGDPARERWDRLIELYEQRVWKWAVGEHPWLAGLDRYDRSPGFDRGLPVIPLRTAVEPGEPLVPMPVPDLPSGFAVALRVWERRTPDATRASWVAGVTEWPFAGRVLAVTTESRQPAASMLARFIGPGPFPRMVRFTDWSVGLTDDDIDTLAELPAAPCLRHLTLFAGQELTTAGLVSLVRGRFTAALHTLSLHLTREPAACFPGFERQFGATPIPDRLDYVSAYRVPRLDGPPLRLRLDDSIPF